MAYKDPQAQIDNQQPKISLVAPGKFGEINQELFNLQTNRQSKSARFSEWLESLFLFSSVFELAIKSQAWITLGTILSLLTQLSWVGTLISVPLVVGFWSMCSLAFDTPLKGAAFYILFLTSFGFILGFL